jgi:hypothetical protein
MMMNNKDNNNKVQLIDELNLAINYIFPFFLYHRAAKSRCDHCLHFKIVYYIFIKVGI